MGIPSRAAGAAAILGAIMRRSGVELALVGITLAWGISFVVLDEAARDAGVWGLTGLRMTVGALAIVLLLRPRFRGISGTVLAQALLGGAILAAGYVLQTAGMKTCEAGAGGFLTALFLPLVPIVDAVVRGRRPTLADLVVLIAATAGILLIATPSADPGAAAGAVSQAASTPGGAPASGLPLGTILVALASVCWAAQIVVVDGITARVEPAALSAIQLAVCAVAGWTGRILAGEGAIRWSTTLGAQVFFLGFVTCGLGFTVQAWAQRRYSPTRIAVIFALEPLFASLSGLWFDGERFPARKMAGCALVTAAVVVTLWLAARRNAGSNPEAGAGTLAA